MTDHKFAPRVIVAYMQLAFMYLFIFFNSVKNAKLSEPTTFLKTAYQPEMVVMMVQMRINKTPRA